MSIADQYYQELRVKYSGKSVDEVLADWSREREQAVTDMSKMRDECRETREKSQRLQAHITDMANLFGLKILV